MYNAFFSAIKILVVDQINIKLCMYNVECLNYFKPATLKTNMLTLMIFTGIDPLQSRHSSHLR